MCIGFTELGKLPLCGLVTTCTWSNKWSSVIVIDGVCEAPANILNLPFVYVIRPAQELSNTSNTFLPSAEKFVKPFAVYLVSVPEGFRFTV